MHSNITLSALLASSALAWSLSVPAAAALPSVFADRETPNLPAPADADDPAIWLHPTDLSKSLVITAVKNGGGRVYDLNASLVQTLSPFPAVGGQVSRYNNVDVQYDFKMFDGSRADIAVASDRGQDVLRVWKIDAANPTTPLSYIGENNPARLFPTLPNGSANPLSAQNTVYGLTMYRDMAADKMYVIGTQRKQPNLAQFELVAQADGTVGARFVRDFHFPTMTLAGSTVSLDDKQFEGVVVDQQTGMLYAGQETVGIWRINLKTGMADANPFVLTRGYDPSSPLTADVEGLTIYYGENGSGYLLASSQGDSTFSIFDRQGSNAHIGSFVVAASGGIDGADHSDGADVTNVALPGYPGGLFITQDGSNGPENGTNFKYVAWGDIARTHGLRVTPGAYDPRTLAPVPEAETWAMMLAGLGLVGFIVRRRKTA